MYSISLWYKTLVDCSNTDRRYVDRVSNSGINFTQRCNYVRQRIISIAFTFASWKSEWKVDIHICIYICDIKVSVVKCYFYMIAAHSSDRTWKIALSGICNNKLSLHYASYLKQHISKRILEVARLVYVNIIWSFSFNRVSFIFIWFIQKALVKVGVYIWRICILFSYLFNFMYWELKFYTHYEEHVS